MPIAHTSLSINIKDNDTETRPAHKNHLKEIVHGYENSTAASRAIAAHAPARECDCDQLKKTCSVVHHRIFMGFDHDAVLNMMISNQCCIMINLSTGSSSSCSCSSKPRSWPTLAEVLECRSMPVIGLQSRTLHTSHCTLHIAHHTLHTAQTKLYTSHYTLHRPHKLTVHSTLCNTYPSILPTTTLTKSHSAQCTHFLLPLSQFAKNLRIHKVYCH